MGKALGDAGGRGCFAVGKVELNFPVFLLPRTIADTLSCTDFLSGAFIG